MSASEPRGSGTIEKLPTRIPGLDALLKGGLPRGRVTLITGRPGTFKSRAALQICCGVAAAGETALFVTVEERPEDLRRSGDELGFSVSSLEAQGRLRLIDFRLPLAAQTEVSGPFDAAPLLERLKEAVRVGGRPALVVIDSLPALLAMKQKEELVRRTVHQVMQVFETLDTTGIIISESPEDHGRISTFAIEEFLADAVIVMRNLVDEKQRRRTVEIAKYRTSDHMKGEFPTAITHGGLTVFPLDMKQAHQTAASTEDRFASGVEGLDRMTHGGWIRDSLVIVRGPSGSGKTTLAGMYALAGVRRGERVFYFGFEETEPILMRNFRSLGLPLEDFKSQGLLRASCAYPESAGIEDLFAELQRQLEQFQPSLIILDSISAIEHAVSPEAFRQFMVGVTSLLRRHGRSALLTQTIPRSGLYETAPYLSTIADAILLLDYRPEQSHARRSLRVVKMRGSVHEVDAYTFEIRSDRGISVGDAVHP